MKNETDFRQRVEKLLKDECAVYYMSSMNRAGIPDLHVIYDQVCGWFELKFVQSLPKSPQARVLDHTLSGGQRRFLKAASGRGIQALALVGYLIDDEPQAVCIPYQDFDEKGNIRKETLLSYDPIPVDNSFARVFLSRNFPQI